MNIATDTAVLRLIESAKTEDLGPGDLTTALMDDPAHPAAFRLLAKQPGTFAGREIAPAVLQAYDRAVQIDWTTLAVDGANLDPVPVHLATIRGPLGPILSAERVLLNFLQRLSGVATLTRRFVGAVAGTGAKILDTRKTTPGWRKLEKYAVRCGGGTNHREGLFDAVLLKDNHLAGIETARLASTVFDMLNRLDHTGEPPTFIEVEADTLDQVEQLLKVVGINVILLDNFSADDLRRAVNLRDAAGLRGRVSLEASGGVNLETVRAIAETGVEHISVGAITHSAVALDLSLERV
ncbi:MAG: carboxylating nicotinate-nucleotide diphosphorylase [Phycisphaerae bacterium]